MADSTSEAVGDCVKAAVEALNLTDVRGVVKRKSPMVPEGDTIGLRQVVVSVGEEGQRTKIDALRDLVKYPVAVTEVSAGGQKAGDDPVVRKNRELIRKKLQDRASYATLSGWNTVTTEGKAPFDASALPKDFNFSTQVFTVEMLESRT